MSLSRRFWVTIIVCYQASASLPSKCVRCIAADLDADLLAQLVARLTLVKIATEETTGL